MDKIGKGIIAGFLATILLSAVFDPMAMLARSAGFMSPKMGWLLHLLVGTLIWGAGFAIMHDILRGPSWLRGVTFGVLAWLVVVGTVVVMRRFGLFGVDIGIATPAVMLAIHVTFGAALGVIYDLLGVETPKRDTPARPEMLHDNDNWHPMPR